MVRHPYLKASPKRKVLGYRRSVPLELRPFVGTREINHSFGTTDIDEARAAYHPFAAQVEAKFALARTRLEDFDADAPIMASKAQLELCASFQAVTRGDAALRADPADCERQYRQCQQRERKFYEETQALAKNDPRSFLNGDRLTTKSGFTFYCEFTPAELRAIPEYTWAEEAHGLGWWYAHLLSCRRRWSRQLEPLDALARGMADDGRTGITSHMFGSQTMACVLSERLAVLHLLAHPELQPLIIPDEDRGVLAHPSIALERTGEAEQHAHGRLSLAVREWIDAHRRTWDTEREALCRAVLEQFIEVCGDKPVSAYSKRDGRKFITLLRQLPPNLSKLTPFNGDLHVAAAAAAKRGLTPQNDRTVNKKIGIVNQCFRWIIAHYDECTTSPVDGMKLPIRQSLKAEREPFTGDQLNTINATQQRQRDRVIAADRDRQCALVHHADHGVLDRLVCVGDGEW